MVEHPKYKPSIWVRVSRRHIFPELKECNLHNSIIISMVLFKKLWYNYVYNYDLFSSFWNTLLNGNICFISLFLENLKLFDLETAHLWISQTRDCLLQRTIETTVFLNIITAYMISFMPSLFHFEVELYSKTARIIQKKC